MFANGHFSARALFKDPEIPKEDWYEDEGLITSADIHGRISIGGKDLVRGDYCLLIARKMEDMTIEEWKNFLNVEHISEIHLRQYKQIYSDYGRRMGFYELDKFLSIGVYPFNQNHFDKGWVITEGRTITRQWWKDQLKEVEAMAEIKRRLYKETGEHNLPLLKEAIHYEEMADYINDRLYD